MIVIGADSSPTLSMHIANELNCTLVEPTVNKFPDGEFYLRIDANLKDETAIIIGHTRTFEQYFKLIFSLGAARDNGARKIIAIIPYFSYSRQHEIYKTGEAISAKIMVRTISDFCDYMATVEIHDEESLSFTDKEFRNIKATPVMSGYFSNDRWDYVISPDDGSLGRAKEFAKMLNCDYAFLDKHRIDANTVEMKLPDLDFDNKSVLLVDDIISTGGTIVKAVKLLKSKGVSKIKVSATHGIFANASAERISAMVDDLVVSDTLSSSYSKISVAGTIAGAIKDWL